MGRGFANKTTLVDRLAGEFDLSTRDAARIMDAVLEAIRDELSQRGRVRLKGFGIFSRRIRKGRAYRHPVTSCQIAVPDRETIVFKPSERLVGAAAEPHRNGRRNGRDDGQAAAP